MAVVEAIGAIGRAAVGPSLGPVSRGIGGGARGVGEVRSFSSITSTAPKTGLGGLTKMVDIPSPAGVRSLGEVGKSRSFSGMPKLDVSAMPSVDRTVPKGELRNAVTVASFHARPNMPQTTPNKSVGQETAPRRNVYRPISSADLPEFHPDRVLPKGELRDLVEVVIHKAKTKPSDVSRRKDDAKDQIAQGIVDANVQPAENDEATIELLVEEQVLAEAEEILERKAEEFAADATIARRIGSILTSLRQESVDLAVPSGQEMVYANRVLIDLSAKRGTLQPAMAIGTVDVSRATQRSVGTDTQDAMAAPLVAENEAEILSTSEVETSVVTAVVKDWKIENKAQAKEEKKDPEAIQDKVPVLDEPVLQKRDEDLGRAIHEVFSSDDYLVAPQHVGYAVDDVAGYTEADKSTPLQKTTHPDGSLLEARERTRRELANITTEHQAVELKQRIIRETPPVKFDYPGRRVSERDVNRVFDRRTARVKS